MDLIHRLPKAVLVTFVAFLFFGGSVGMVMAVGTEPLPEEFGIAEPRVGDRWEYEAILESRTEYADGTVIEDDEPSTDLTGLEWFPSEIINDQDGQPRHAHALREIGMDQSYYIAADNHRAIATSFGYDYESSRSSSIRLLGFVDAGTQSNVQGDREVVAYFNDPAPCSFFTELQGNMLPMDAPVRVAGSCLDFEEEADEETLFDPIGVETVNGMDAVKFQATRDQNATTLWYAPDIPYPVRMQIHVEMTLEVPVFDDIESSPDSGFSSNSDIEFEFEEITTFFDADVTMTGFEPGTEPWGDMSAPLPPPRPSPELTTTTVTGPDDSGIDHPYPLSVAYDGAVNDITFTSFRTWMEDHPDAVMVQAESFASVDGDHDVYGWTFLMWDNPDDGQHYFSAVEAERRIARPGTSAETTQAATGPEDSYSSSSTGAQPGEVRIPERDNIPSQAPSVASAMATFEAATGTPATTYGFDYTCSSFCWFGEENAVMVGREESVEQPGDPVTGEPGTVNSSRHAYWFNDQGQLTLEERENRREETWEVGLLGVGGATPQNHADEGSMPPAKRAAWVAPPPEATASISFVAVLIGLAYWLWPTAKALPFMAGFSRVQSDKMLEHPGRAAIYEAIKEQPGIHYQQLLRQLGKGASVVEHHIRKLELGGYICAQKGAGVTCFFPKGLVDYSVMSAVPALKTDGAVRILREILARPGQSSTDLAAHLGLAKSTVSYHVSRLRKAHLLEDGRSLIPTEEAQQAIAYAA